MYTFDSVYNRIRKHGEIIDFEKDEFILWNNEAQTVQRIALFENGLFVDNEIVARIK